VSADLDVKTQKLIAEYQQVSLLEKEALVACPAAKEALIALLIELQKPTRQRRINAKQLARLVTGLTRHIVPAHQLFKELLTVPMSLEHWNSVRKAAEHEPGELYDKWRALLDDVSQIRNEVLLDYVYLAKHLAYTFSQGDAQLREDFESYAIISLIRALDTFKPHLEIPFRVHAYKWMLSYLSRMSDRQASVNTSEPARRLLGKYHECKAALTVAFSRTPRLEEIADRLEVAPEKLASLIPMAKPLWSLDAEGEDGATLHERLSDTSGVTPRTDLDDLKRGILKALSGLSEPDKIVAAFYLEMNLNEVTAETTYALAPALDVVKDWTKQRLATLLSQEEEEVRRDIKVGN
jgi:DNA-directed RNA polymerase specialized sigma subunit